MMIWLWMWCSVACGTRLILFSGFPESVVATMKMFFCYIMSSSPGRSLQCQGSGCPPSSFKAQLKKEKSAVHLWGMVIREQTSSKGSLLLFGLPPPNPRRLLISKGLPWNIISAPVCAGPSEGISGVYLGNKDYWEVWSALYLLWLWELGKRSKVKAVDIIKLMRAVPLQVIDAGQPIIWTTSSLFTKQ